jgi:hypothetical protein
MANHVCKGVLHTADGVAHECSQLASDSAKSGLTLCYLHDKYAEGLAKPDTSPYPEENVTHMTVTERGSAYIFPFSEGVTATPAIEEAA